MILPLVLWRLAMGGSARMALCASPAGMGPSTASPTLTILPSPCWQCSSASPWRAGQMCYTGYVAWNGWRHGVQKAASLSSTSPFSIPPPHDFVVTYTPWWNSWWMSLISSRSFLRNKAWNLHPNESLCLPTSVRKMSSLSLSYYSEKHWCAADLCEWGGQTQHKDSIQLPFSL